MSPKELIARVPMTNNLQFPLTLEYVNHIAMKAIVEEITRNWHKRFGHLNFKSLKLFHDKELVYGLLEIKESHHICESYAKGK